MISIHPQINSREVLRFTAALFAATRERGDAFIFLFSLIHCFSCLCPWQTFKLIFLLAWFCAALQEGCPTNVWRAPWPTQARRQGRGRRKRGMLEKRELVSRYCQTQFPHPAGPILSPLPFFLGCHFSWWHQCAVKRTEKLGQLKNNLTENEKEEF